MPIAVGLGFLILWWWLGFWWAVGIALVSFVATQSDSKTANTLLSMAALGSLVYLVFRFGLGLVMDILGAFI